MYAWLQLEENASSQFPFNYSYANWFANRQNPAFNLLGANRTVPFSINMGGRPVLSSATDTINLVGVAPLRVFKVEVAGRPGAAFAWLDESNWSLTGVPLNPGVNELTVNGVDEFGTVLHQIPLTVTRTGSGLPAMAIQADPASWQVPVLEPLTLSISDSSDLDGTPVEYSWSVTPAEASLEIIDDRSAVAAFPHPGLYTIKVTGKDAGGASATIQREAAVYGLQGLSRFDSPRLDSFWNLENVVLRPNYTAGPYYSLTEVPGSLVLQVWNDRAFPLGAASPKYPLVWRSLPASTDWAFISRLSLKGQVFGDYVTGILAETIEGGIPVRYVFGIEDGSWLGVRRILASGAASLLNMTPWNVSDAEIRIRRIGDTLAFEQRVDGIWLFRHLVPLPARSTAARAGMVLATDTPQSVKIAFDYAILIDPSDGL
jgi:hypothetical protein